MIDSGTDNSTELSFCGNQTSFTIESVDKEQQTKEDIQHYNGKQRSLLSLDSFDNFIVKNDIETDVETQNTFLFSSIVPTNTDVDDELFDDFDPENALVFKKPLVSKQVPHSVQNHSGSGVKRKHSDDSHRESSHNYSKHSAKRFTMDYGYENVEAKFLESMIVEEYCAKMKRPKLDMSQPAAWRLGPAKYWFDILGIPESGDGFDYGFELAREIEEDESYPFDIVDEDAFLMVSQVHWEDNIIWDIDDAQEQKLSNNNGIDWVPTPTDNSPVLYEKRPNLVESQNGTWYSDFPMENEKLVYGLWENEIIWDAKAMKTILQPKILELDPNDENIIFGIPEDLDLSLSCDNIKAQSNVKIPYPHAKNNKSILRKTGMVNLTDKQKRASSTLELLNLDPFNISNDIYYMLKSNDSKLDIGQQKHIPHSVPVLQLQTQLVPTYMGPTRLRNFHRSPLKLYKRGCLARPEQHPVLSLTKFISKKEKLRQQALTAGELFFMRSFQDLSGRDGNLVLVEFSEEYPPLMNFVGMCSKIKNYYKRKLGKDIGPPKYKYGETAYSQNNLFLGNLAPGQSLQALENNLYRAPIYEHKVSETDFLVIRTRNQYYIREIDALYVAGQQCPLYEVPAPNTKKVTDFMRNFLQVFVYKAFLKSKTNPPKINKDVLKKAFPTVKAPFIKRNLSICANYNYTKGGPDSSHWVLKPTFRLPLEDELRMLVSPEQCCAYFSMVAAQQRLKDAGYGDKSIFALHDNDVNDEVIQSRLDDEIKAAPWNTTRAYIEAMNGKCCLQLTGPADPTGCGEAFSYIRVPLKTMFKQDEEELKSKKITGTEADLRYLSVKGAETILRNYGVPAQDIKKLTRWGMIDAVRTLSTIREDRGEEGFSKFSRSKRFSVAGYQQRYKDECQRIFDLQNRILSSNEVYSSDDEDEYKNEGDEDVKKMAEDIESLLINKEKSGSLLEFEREEREREELLKMLANEDAPIEKKPIETKKDEMKVDPNGPRVLTIRRTFRNADGSEYTRTETVRDLAVIDAYLEIRSTKDAVFIKQYANADEELEREKKKIEAELKNMKERERRKEKNQNKTAPTTKVSFLPTSDGEKIRCRACGRYGHIETSSICRNALKNQLGVEDQELVKVDGTKLKFSMKLIKDAEETNTKTSTQNTPKGKRALPKKRKQPFVDEQVDYNKHCLKTAGANRHRTNPVVLLLAIFEEILTIIRGHKEFQPFLYPINTKSVCNYRRIIGRPMDLNTIRSNIQKKKYESREDFLADIVQIKENSARYNGPMHSLTDCAQKMLNLCVKLLAEKEDKIIKLENAIKPPVDDNDQKAFSDMISMVIKEIKSMPEAIPFLMPVNKNLVGSKIYYNIVKNPMDLETISKKNATYKYGSRGEVIQDFQLIYNNCVLYNGKNSSMKTKAQILLKTVEERFDGLSHQILHLESSIASVQDKAMRQANIDTSWKYEDVATDDVFGAESKLSEKILLNLSEDKFQGLTMNTDYTDKTDNSRFATECEVSVKSSLNLSEDDSDDSSTDTNCIKKKGRPAKLPTTYEPCILEEDLKFSSDDEL